MTVWPSPALSNTPMGAPLMSDQTKPEIGFSPCGSGHDTRVEFWTPRPT